MQLIKPSVQIIPQEEGLLGVYKQIEKAGRTCYKSEDRITEDSAEKFVQKMIDLGHTAMLEHGTVYLFIPWEDYFSEKHFRLYEVSDNQYSKTYCKHDYNVNNLHTDGVWITTNYRVLVENNVLDSLEYISEPKELHQKRVTARFICDRGVSHELVRHRVFSFAQESSRQWRH